MTKQHLSSAPLQLNLKSNLDVVLGQAVWENIQLYYWNTSHNLEN